MENIRISKYQFNYLKELCKGDKEKVKNIIYNYFETIDLSEEEKKIFGDFMLIKGTMSKIAKINSDNGNKKETVKGEG